MESVFKTKFASRGWHFTEKHNGKVQKKDKDCMQKRKMIRSH